MKTIITVLMLGVLIRTGYGQTSEKQFVFNKDDEVYCEYIRPDAVKFTPSMAEISTADSLAEIHIKKNKQDHGSKKEISDYRSYYRQYLGYLNEKKERIIFINSFCRPEKNWTKEIVNYRGGGACYFNIKINLDTKEASDFNVNAPK